MIREAMLYDKLADQIVHCNLCAHRCTINPGRRGICGVRENKGGVLYSLVYGTLISEHIDPIEKKPFFHVYPASRSYCLFRLNRHPNPQETNTQFRRKSPPPDWSEATLVFSPFS